MDQYDLKNDGKKVKRNFDGESSSCQHLHWIRTSSFSIEENR
jgi:hypothetical protein